MEKSEKRRLKAGLPPWLFLALILLVYRLPYSMKMLHEDINDILTIEEYQQVNLAVNEIEDGSSLFPLEFNKPSSDRMEDLMKWMEKEQQKAKQQHVKLRDWVMGGACVRFRATAGNALIVIDQAKRIEEKHKILRRQLVSNKKEMLALRLEEFNSNELAELIRQDSGSNVPQSLSKTEIISYLLEPGVRIPKETERTWSWQASSEAWQSRVNLILSKPTILIDLSIPLIPIFALVWILLPRWRGQKIEKKFGLMEDKGSFPEIREIQKFVTSYVPNIEVRVNLLRPDAAFVYSMGYRQPRLAVLAGMYMLWRSNQESAQAVLLHEIEHVRQGDHLLVGYSDFFKEYLKSLFIGFAGIMALHLIIGIFFSTKTVGVNWSHQGKLLGILSFNSLTSAFSVFFQMMSKIIMPLLGLWAVELNADYAVIRAGNQQLEGMIRSSTATRAFFNMLTHPPRWLRIRLSKNDDWFTDMLRHIIFPISFILAILMFFLMGLFAKMPDTGLFSKTLPWLLGLCRESFASMYWIFGSIAVIVLFWPFIAGYWEYIFVGERRCYQYWGKGRCAVALLLTIFSISAWLLRIPA